MIIEAAERNLAGKEKLFKVEHKHVVVGGIVEGPVTDLVMRLALGGRRIQHNIHWQ